MNKYEELANKISDAVKSGNHVHAQDLLTVGVEVLAKELKIGYFECKEMVVFFYKGM